MPSRKPETIVFEVGDYAYGSLTMALSVATHLKDRYELICLASRRVIEPLREASLFSSVYEVTEPDITKLLPSLIARRRVRLVCDFSVYTDETWDVCEATLTPLLYIDMHLWRRKKSHIRRLSSRANSPRLLFEDYPGIENDLRCVGLGRDSVVPPIVGELEALPRRGERKIIVNLGGADSAFAPYYSNPYPAICLNILNNIFQSQAQGYSILVCCGTDMAEHLNRTGTNVGRRVVSLPRREYLEELATASLFITQPSIHSPFEGFLLSKPTMLLPPQNFTQCFHLQQWNTCGIGYPGSNLTDIYRDLSLQPRGDEKPQEKKVQDVLKRLAEDRSTLERLTKMYRDYFEFVIHDQQRCLLKQNEVSETLGADRGAAEVSRLIVAQISGRETITDAVGQPPRSS